MAPLSAILRHVRRIAPDQAVSPSDAELLVRYARGRDDEAFEELLARHGPLVWGVCRRLVSDRHTAEDAFQATFLVLARRAKTIRRPESLACWLHGVARRAAGRLRSPPARCADSHDEADPSLTPLDRVS